MSDLDPEIHTFAPNIKTFIPQVWLDVSLAYVFDDFYSKNGFPAYFKRLRLERRRKKIKHRQKRAAFRRRKRGQA